MKIVKISAGDWHSLILAENGDVYSAGENANGECGLGSELTESLGFIKVPNISNIVGIVAGDDYSLALREDGKVFMAGNSPDDKNFKDFVEYEMFEPVIEIFKDWTIVTTSKIYKRGKNQEFIIHEDGSVWATGWNGYGELGDGTTVSKSTPTKVIDSVKQVSARYCYTMFLKTDGSVWATGRNDLGQLGDRTTVNRSTPVKVMDNVKEVSAGYYCTMFLKTDGSVWATGLNSLGQLGDGTTIDKSTPVKVMDNVKEVSVGDYYTMFLKTDGSVWATGRNYYGQLGDGTTTVAKSTPVKVMDNVKEVSAGGDQTMFLKTDGSVWATGYNGNGQLGDGTGVDKSTPVRVF